jgi:hypothetical protein
MARPRKRGNRTKSGRLSKVQPIDKGCDGVIRRQAIYAATRRLDDDTLAIDGSQTFDAIGRAWSAGLLGDDERAAQLRDGARKIAARYWVVFGEYGGADSLARFQPSAGNGPPDSESERRQEEWLNASLKRVTSLGRAYRDIFDAICLDINPDHGPLWLDQVIWQTKRGVSTTCRDAAAIERLVIALDAVC